MIHLRPYQRAAVDEIWRFWQAGGGNPLIEMATGTGKSLTIAEICRRLQLTAPRRILITAHRQELLEQNERAIRALIPGADVGIYCAGLRRRESTAAICLASINSIFRDAAGLMGQRNLTLIDEAHLVPKHDAGMYRAALASLRAAYAPMRLAGLTATPYRLDSGRLDEGPDRLFDQVVFTYHIGDAVADGWLCPLTSRPMHTQIDTSNVRTVNHEFQRGDLERAADAVTTGAVAEILTHGAPRRSWLVFCAGVEHTGHVVRELANAGIHAVGVTEYTRARDRRLAFERFKSGAVRALVGCDIFTTGFDAQNVDMIALLRPTKSTGLYVQMLGRGTRPVYPDGFDPNGVMRDERIAAFLKPNCLVLDFAGNLDRHGPVDAVTPRDAPVPTGESASPSESSGERERRVDLDPTASGAPAMTRDLTWMPVEALSVQEHRKDGRPPSLRINYHCGSRRYSDFLPFEHGGAARTMARKKWQQIAIPPPIPIPAPNTTAEALRRANELATNLEITVVKKGAYWQVVGRRIAA